MDNSNGVKKRKVMKNAKDQKLDDAVSTWFIQKRNLEEPISGPLLCEKSLEFNKNSVDQKTSRPALVGYTISSFSMEYVNYKFKVNHYISELKCD